MIIEHECRMICKHNENEICNLAPEFVPDSSEFLTRVIDIENTETFCNLRDNLAEHLYQKNMNK